MKNIKKGTLTKFNSVWHVSYAAEPSGENVWVNKIPIRNLNNQGEQYADLILVQIFNKPVCNLEGTEVSFYFSEGKAVLV